VGKDQEQNLEMTRRFARRFNTLYEVDYFPEPTAYNFGQQLVKIPGLDGSGKMGKSEGNALYLTDEPAVIRKKVMRAVTDSGPTQPGQEMSEPVKNLFTIMQVISAPETYQHFLDLYNKAEIRYGDMKKQLAEDIITFTAPIRERVEEIKNDRDYLRRVVRHGAEQARESAAKTVREVREIIGFKPF
jgi:tryptophanyl-tRNA synthetase